MDLPTNGTALQRADVYTYRTADYAMSTTQAYQPGAFGNQEAIFQLILDPGVSLFHNHLPDHPGYGRSAVLDLEPVDQREDLKGEPPRLVQGDRPAGRLVVADEHWGAVSSVRGIRYVSRVVDL